MNDAERNTQPPDEFASLRKLAGDMGLDPQQVNAAFARAREAAAASDGAGLLNDIRSFVRRFCVFPDEHCLTAVTLWAAHAHMVEEFHTTPRLAVLSPEASSGKTRVLEVLDLLVPESLLSLNASPAAVFRTLANKQITLLLDEVDAIWNKRGQDDNHEDLRALLNAGYRRGATIPRCVGPRHDVQLFKVYCAVALAGLGDLPDTIMSRAIILRMRRRAPQERLDPFRIRTNEPQGHELRERLRKWAVSVGPQAGEAWPELPSAIVDRAAEVWEPLIAIADAAGGPWPKLARDACVELCKVAQDRRMSLGIRLLADLRVIFEKAGNPGAMHTQVIVDRLVDGEVNGLEADAPWGELHGKPLDKRRLASMLAKYSIRPTKVTVGGCSLQGYRLEHLWDVWGRYLPPVSSAPAQPELPELPASQAGNHGGKPIPDVIPAADADPELPECPITAAASPVPAIPGIPGIRQAKGASEVGAAVCRRCGGEGCKWCEHRGTPGAAHE